MATARQVEANRINALKSTGPRTEQGKARSRGNALAHGMAGEGAVVEEAAGAAFRRRREAWAGEFRPEGESGDWALDRAVGASIRIERCERAFDGVLERHAERAALAWDQDRRAEAAATAARLSREPTLAARRLETTRHGVDLLIELWMRLGEALQVNRDLSAAERSTALDLLGVPAHLRDGRTPLDPTDEADPLLFVRDLILDEVDRLETLQSESLDRLDDLDRRQAEEGGSGFFSREARLILRYERDAYRWLREAMQALRSAPAPAAEPAPAPAPGSPRPAPVPVPPPAAPRWEPAPFGPIPTPDRAPSAGVPLTPAAFEARYRRNGPPAPFDAPGGAYSYADFAATPIPGR